jgi:hypothetical protein
MTYKTFLGTVIIQFMTYDNRLLYRYRYDWY